MRVRLTDKGEALVPEVMRTVHAVYRRGLRNFTAAERMHLFEDLQRVIDAL